jgi:uncharacterized protein
VKRSGDAIALFILTVSLAIMTQTALAQPERWPWIWAALVFAVPFLVLLFPKVQSAAAQAVTGRPALAYAVPAALTAAAIAGGLLYNATIAPGARAIEPWRIAALPVFVALGVVAAGRGTAALGGWRLLAGALALGLVAGMWDRALKIPVPGNTPIGLTFFLAVALGIFLYRAVRPQASLDVGFGMPSRDLFTALGGFAGIVAIAIPVGFALSFVVWNPRLSEPGHAFARLLGLIVFVGIPEELLFRGMIQEGIGRLKSPRVGWIVASLIFGLSHITKGTGLTPEQRAEDIFGLALNWRYALMATIAGLGYGWVYLRTGRVSAAAITHGAVNWVWSGFFGR